MEKIIKQNDAKRLLRFLKILILLTIIIVLNGMSVKAADNTVVSVQNWDEWQKEDYWEWHTRTTTNDIAYNGVHVAIKNNVIDFYGYGQISYKDFLYKDYNNSGKKIFKFRIDEAQANYHTLDGAGFIFNASKINDKLSGYIILFKETTVCLYKLDDVDINMFEATPDTTIDTYGGLITSIDKSDSKIRDLVIEASPTNIKVTEGGMEILNVDLDYSKNSGNGFGLISSYTQHDCKILSIIEFSQMQIDLKDYKITVLNTDLKDMPIQGGYFELKDENGEKIKEGQADNDGEFIVEGLKGGVYTIQQKTTSEDYILNDAIYKFKFTNDGKVVDVNTEKEINIVVKNEKKQIENNKDNEEDKKDNSFEEKSNGTNNKSNTSKEYNSDKKDNTISSISIPNTGERTLGICIDIIIITILGIYGFIKIKKSSN